MPTIGVAVAVLKSGQILLVKREDFAIWALPGGGIESGESIAQAAVREVCEETGLRVKLTRLVGLYSQPLWLDGGSHTILLAAHVIGGEMRPQVGEVLEVGFFDPKQLPSPMAWWHQRRIHDAVNGVGGSVVWLQKTVFPLGSELAQMSRQELYRLRDRGKLPLEQLYSQIFRRPKPEDEVLEVGEESGDHPVEGDTGTPI